MKTFVNIIMVNNNWLLNQLYFIDAWPEIDVFSLIFMNICKHYITLSEITTMHWHWVATGFKYLSLFSVVSLKTVMVAWNRSKYLNSFIIPFGQTCLKRVGNNHMELVAIVHHLMRGIPLQGICSIYIHHCLTNCGRVTHTRVGKITTTSSDNVLVHGPTWKAVNWTLRNRPQGYFNGNSNISIQENALRNGVHFISASMCSKDKKTVFSE